LTVCFGYAFFVGAAGIFSGAISFLA